PLWLRYFTAAARDLHNVKRLIKHCRPRHKNIGRLAPDSRCSIKPVSPRPATARDCPIPRLYGTFPLSLVWPDAYAIRSRSWRTARRNRRIPQIRFLERRPLSRQPGSSLQIPESPGSCTDWGSPPRHTSRPWGPAPPSLPHGDPEPVRPG